MNFLTFDLGTTLYKVALFDETGKLLALERAVAPIERRQPLWAEVSAQEFLHVLQGATQKLRACCGDAWDDLAAVSFATQANSFTFLSESGEATMPIILWSDQRAAELAGEVAAISALPGFRQSTGMPRFGPMLALAKVLWLRRNHSEALAGARQLCFISDFLTSFLTGEVVTAAGVAGLSGALDIAALTWRDDVLARVNLPPIAMPAVYRAGTDLGPLSAERAAGFGLPPACRFVVGALDQYAGAIGTGTVEPGRVCETTGTVLAAVRCTDRLGDDLPDDVFQGPAFDAGRFFQMSFSSTSANLLEWYRDRVPGRPSFEELTKQAASAPDCDLVIETYDDRGPIEAAFRHVRPEHTAGQVVRAIMQRVAQSLKGQVEHLCGAQLPAEIRSAGGAARNDLWLQIKADAVDVPIVATECEEPTSLGAAMLAGRAMGLGSLAELSRRWVKTRARFEPHA